MCGNCASECRPQETHIMIRLVSRYICGFQSNERVLAVGAKSFKFKFPCDFI